ncbi:hypothetical protein [Streptomyces sp. enrichment culture]|uniref:hypothetical protein n=1 Tax=Streptomyces sp. enrichment culture TaxID=1795815 RepID=UPI003F56EE87
MDGDGSNAWQQHVIDWLEQAADLPHLIARVSELVHRLGYEPQDLVVLPRAELDRRELAAYRAGWVDVVEEGLPSVRRAYEERITAAYLQGQADARTGRRARRGRRAEGEEGGEVIPLPFAHRPSSEVTRGERERPGAEGVPVPREESGVGGSGTAAPSVERGADSSGPAGGEPSPSYPGGGDPSPSYDFLLSAREVREKRAMPEQRRPVARRKGRPSVPPLPRRAEPGAAGRGERPPRRDAGVPEGHASEDHGLRPDGPASEDRGPRPEVPGGA